MNSIALDTNILIYLHDINGSRKRAIVSDLMMDLPMVSSQVISEYLNVCHKRLKISKESSLESLMGWLPYCNLYTTEPNTFSEALRLIKQYQFQMFDAVIVASALMSNCDILYSEDMQHNLLVNNQLRVINPFVG